MPKSKKSSAKKSEVDKTDGKSHHSSLLEMWKRAESRLPTGNYVSDRFMLPPSVNNEKQLRRIKDFENTFGPIIFRDRGKICGVIVWGN